MRCSVVPDLCFLQPLAELHESMVSAEAAVAARIARSLPRDPESDEEVVNVQ